MKINIEKCLELFDERHEGHRGHATSIIGILGEDLAAGSFIKYMEFKKTPVEIIDSKFQATSFQGKKFKKGHGPRLDRWFIDRKKNILYQCEIWR